jgi:hypothetical protein
MFQLLLSCLTTVLPTAKTLLQASVNPESWKLFSSARYCAGVRLFGWKVKSLPARSTITRFGSTRATWDPNTKRAISGVGKTCAGQ